MGDTSNSNGNATAANSVTAERNVTMAGSAVNGAISSTISGAISSALRCGCDCARATRSVLRRISLIMPLVIVLLLELVWFNFPAIESAGFNPTPIQSVSTGAGLIRHGDVYTVTGKNDQYIQLHYAQPSQINNIYVDTRSPQTRTLDIAVYVLDGGNSASYIQVASQPVTSNVNDTKYVRVHAVDKVAGLRLSTKLQKGDSFTIANLALNQRRPLHISLVRVVMLLLIAYAIYVLAPRSRIYKEALDLRVRKQQLWLVALVLVQCAILIGVTKVTGTQHMFTAGVCNNGGFVCDANQYNHLANSLLKGHLYLDLPVPDWLPNMSNPYDAGARYAMSIKTGQPTYWDYAFHGSHYFTYFGALPALLLFVPFKVLTGHDLRTDYAVAFFAVAFAIASLYLMVQLLRRFFPKRSFGFLVLSHLIMLMSSGVLIQAYLPQIYSLPMLSSLCFTCLGLGLWLQARTTQDTLSENPCLRKSLLILGAVCIALNLGCRPQFILASLFAFVIFKEEIVKYRLFFAFKRSSVINTVCVIAPMILIGLAACWYNYARFGSPLDFGATYNLTGFDMVHRSYSWARIPWGVWMYLFQPITITPVFPFMEQSVLPSMFHGQIIMEPFFGGLLAYSPVCAAVVLYPLVKQQLRKKQLAGFFTLGLTLSILLMVLDAEVVGISSRYFSDFGWLLALCAIMVIASLVDKVSSCVHMIDVPSGCVNETDEESPSKANLKLMHKVLIILVISSVGLCSLNLLANGRYSDLQGTRPSVYRSIESWFSPLT